MSVGKVQRKNNSLFEQLIKDRSTSISKGSSTSKQTRVKNSSGSHYNERDKENLNVNRGSNVREKEKMSGLKGVNLEKFSQGKAPGTFAALRKVTGTKFNR